MKKLLTSLRSLLSLGAGAKDTEPSEPIALHDFLYKRAADLSKPYLVLHGVAAKCAKSESAKAQLEEAISLFDRVLAINPQNWAAAWLAGKAAHRLGQLERAYGYFARSFDVQKENPDVARELMLTCLDTKRAQEAVAVAEHATRLTPSDAGLQANLALARLCSADIVGAEAAIDAALKQDARDEISITLKRLIGEVRRGERKQPKTPADLES
jgi:Flp pilus assembly protein TadD